MNRYLMWIYYVAACIVITCIITGTTTDAALYCYSCGWSSDPGKCLTKKETESVEEERSEDLTYPLPDTCIHTSENRPPSVEDLRKKCHSVPCKKDDYCLRWSFLTSGSPENITYKCVGNPGNRNGRFLMEISDPDEEKKYNKKTLKVEIYLCNENNCNKATLHSHTLTLMAMALVVTLILTNKR